MKKIKSFFKKDWKNIHQDFTPELKKQWKDKGFNYEQTKEWVDIGLQPGDADYAEWLRDVKKVDSDWVHNYGNDEELREEYEKSLANDSVQSWLKTRDEYVNINKNDPSSDTTCDQCKKVIRKNELAENDLNFCSKDCCSEWNNEGNWESIHPSFTLELKKQWKKKGFSYEECKEWMDINLRPNDIDFVYWLAKAKGLTPSQVATEERKEELKEICKKEAMEELQKEARLAAMQLFLFPFLSSLKETKDETFDAQEYINQQYPTEEDKINCQFLNIGTKDENNPEGIEEKLTGFLDLTGFANLEVFICNGQEITNLKLKSCAELKALFCWNNQLTELELSNCSQLKKLDCSGNKLTNLDLVGCVNLEKLHCQNNQLNKLDLNSCINLKELNCEANQLTELNVSNCFNLKEFFSQNNQLTVLEIKCPSLTTLKCWNNKISTLDLTNCSQLVTLECYENQLTQLTFPPKLPDLIGLVCHNNFLTNLDFTALNEEKLMTLMLMNNNFFAPRDLSCLAKFNKLLILGLGSIRHRKNYDNWTGSLKSLKNMRQLTILHIDNTDIDSGAEYLPSSIMEIECSYFLRQDIISIHKDKRD